jgi:Rod binding domain-containing protein
VDGMNGLMPPVSPVDLTALAPAPRTDAAEGQGSKATIEKTARDFESVLLYRVFEEMRRTVPDSGLLDSGSSDQVQSMFWMFLAQEVAGKGGLGLAKDLSRQLSRQMHDQAAPENPGVKA